MSQHKEPKVMIEVTAQPIHDDGSIGFDNQPPIVTTGTLAEALALMADELAAYPEYTAWDLTLVPALNAAASGKLVAQQNAADVEIRRDRAEEVERWLRPSERLEDFVDEAIQREILRRKLFRNA